VGERGKPRIYYVDPCPSECASVQGILSKHFDCVTFQDLSEFLEIPNGHGELLIVDISLLDLDRPNPLLRLREKHPALPVIAAGQSAVVSEVVRLVKSGVADFIVKPFDQYTLFSRAVAAIRDPNSARLTRNEKMVLTLLAQGKSNKEMARVLSRSVRTIEDHRARLMKKIGASNLVDLIKYALGLNLANGLPRGGDISPCNETNYGT
jgi:two-component system, LuxR family, response regulator FixJ